MDSSAFLILPFSGLISFATMLWYAIASRPAPRLIWPCAFSSVLASLLFLRMPGVSMLGLWVMTILSMAFSAAIGTVVGAAMARLAGAAFRWLRRS